MEARCVSLHNKFKKMEESMSFFIRLLETTDASRRQLEEVPKIQAMLKGRISKDEYKAFLIELYHIVVHSRKVMDVAANHCSEESGEVRHYLDRKIANQAGHGEMLLNDLSAFSVAEQSVAACSPSFAVQSMLGYNHYACEHIHPCCVVGMLYALELITSVYGSQLADAISISLDMSLKKGFTFLDSQSAMDIDRLAELRALLQTIDNPDIQKIIIHAIQMNLYLLIAVLKSDVILSD
jgi:pyrroloquinoline quinone (PQQ) biosynthesis protein C